MTRGIGIPQLVHRIKFEDHKHDYAPLVENGASMLAICYLAKRAECQLFGALPTQTDSLASQRQHNGDEQPGIVPDGRLDGPTAGPPPRGALRAGLRS